MVDFSKLIHNMLIKAIHYMALITFIIAIDVLLFGGFKFYLGTLKISATQLLNPLLLTLGFTGLGKILGPSFSLSDTPLARIFRRVQISNRRLNQFRINPIAFWIGFIFLNILLFLPGFLVTYKVSTLIPFPDLEASRGWYDNLLFFIRRKNQDFFRLSGDVLLILTILKFLGKGRWKKLTFWGCFSFYILILIYQIYESATMKIYGEKPLLYNDVILIWDAIFILGDLWSLKLFHLVIRVIAWCGIIIYLIHLALQYFAFRMERLNLKSPITLIGLIVWPIAIFSGFWYSFDNDDPAIRWIGLAIYDNAQKSNALYKTLQSYQASSSFMDTNYNGVKLENAPNVYLLMIESYGKIVVENPKFKNVYHREIKNIELTLEQQGWISSTNYSESTVSGGHSWLSFTTVLTGVPIDNQPAYEFILRSPSQFPHLINYFNFLGYNTIKLQPLRNRAGIPFNLLRSFYNFSTWVNFEDLEYTGKKFGWAGIPDQYSLNFTHEKYLQYNQQPYFLFFITLTSHFPWQELPPFLSDWTKISNPLLKPQIPSEIRPLSNHWPKTMKNIFHRLRKKLGFSYALQLEEYLFEDYLNHILYQLQYLSDFIINKVPDNSIIIIIGDHQPPVLTSQGDSFQTPIHIISKNNDFLESFGAYGFIPGLTKNPDIGNTLKHAGIYSMVIRQLGKHYGSHQKTDFPKYYPNGIPLSAYHD
ncbi:sulfatase-like hydrolase/transferase [Caldithrix abyssi]|nr:sulfatase-like hydrolase/transferase [Caldithrix abyssi]